jgi:hypothetical protein
MNNDKNLTVKYLEDIPISSDLFEPLEKVANALYESIEKQTGGKAIAIFGTWGSGKSSIIELLKKRFNKNNKCLFIFDGWAHEGNPLRRVFLVKLIDELLQKKWISDKEVWEDNKEQIQGKSSRIKKTISPILTWRGIIMAITLFFCAFYLSISPYGNNWRWQYLYFLPILCAFIFFVEGVVRKKIKCFSDLPKFSKEFLGLFIKSHIDQEITEVSELPEPSTPEFEQHFDKLLEDALRNNDRKLIIVLDNLDRADSDETKKIFATLKPFIQSSTRTNILRNQVYYLFPLDPAGLCRIFKHNNDRELKDNNHKELIKAFIEKNFQIRFYMPPLKYLEWREYFTDNIKLAFSHLTEDDIYNIRTIYDNLRRGTKPERLEPTPREIKVFINNMVAVYLSKPIDIPISSIALYVALREFYPQKLNKYSEKAIHTELPHQLISKIHYLLMNDWQKDILSLCYGAPYDKVLEIMCYDKIVTSLQNGDKAFFAQIKQDNKLEDLQPIIDRIFIDLSSEWSNSDPRRLLYSVVALEPTLEHK